MHQQPIRYTFGGDEHLFAEVSESMSLPAFFRSLGMVKAIEKENISGILDICLANASFQVRFNPDEILPNDLLAIVKSLESSSLQEGQLDTRIVEIPVLYNDPWTYETLMRFRDRHQDPDSTDMEYAARINGHADTEAFIKAHSGSPWFVSMVGFVSGLPFMFQMVDQEHQIEVPKYLSPRTDTPKQTLGHGGCFGCIYSVRGAGGYQMFGVTPAPIYDPEQALSYLKESMVFFRAGDIVKFKPINRDEYDQMLIEVEKGLFTLKTQPFVFDLATYLANPDQYKKDMMEVLYVD
ncbi:carboxyltransferase domain-containing protein [Neptunomonas phycophila]|jgi:urea carboxylase|uniref:Carboxyltransferase domain-containing protein n=1 Tax=Neptunomonas phycophila TaxID=1572645 RepID=A0ABT9EQZ0_9GAMM|nr:MULTISPECIES: carboxyltransferase domain-containing protein [Neptunomonas]MDN2658536.1 carboxyltransferase domain-containing protein [Neptunomonas sp. CHC150]MDP2521475.1 carboxyltransferase domain-containing protein [Neptunomonas phycophila]QLE98519.1 carboxyltransferase domain-containing protein [Neptunomonas phycophila]